MLLAIDVGNTEVKLGLWNGSWTVVRRPSQSLLQVGLAPWLRETLAGRSISAAICASVLPALDGSVKNSIKAVAGLEPSFLSTSLPLGFESKYRTPQTLGADRLANVLGALATRSRPVIVVDFGTATKIEAVGSDGVYLGGAILPGLEGSAMSLVKGTAKLPPVPLNPPDKAIGDSTETAMQSGIVYGHAAAVEGMLAVIGAEVGAPAQQVIATGGLSHTMAPLCRTITRVEPTLTLDGIREGATRLGIYEG